MALAIRSTATSLFGLLFSLVISLSGQEEGPDLRFLEVAEGLERPVDIQDPQDGSNRLFIVEQAGRIQIIKDGAVLSAPFLDIADRVRDVFNEEGLLGLAFSPNFPADGIFYVNYTNGATSNSRRTRISRFPVDANDPDRADPDSEDIIFTESQPFANHNAGQLQFGPDGFLYIGLGDGGSANDPGNRAQNPQQFLGKMLRVDVSDDDFASDSERDYSIPDSNPFVGGAGTLDEIWALGLRNPWRYSFDRLTGDLYIADVGQDTWEEIEFQPAESDGGENYGWRIREGANNFIVPGGGVPGGLSDPVFEYRHSNGNLSVTGGYVYRGANYPRMDGLYLYGDFGSGRIWGLRRDGQNEWVNQELANTSFGISSFGEDEAGDLYVADLFSGRIFLLTDLGLLVGGAAKLVNTGTLFMENFYNGYELLENSGSFSSIAGEITRISFLDLGGDLVFAEFGSEDPDTILTISLEDFRGSQASPYNQPTTTYVQGLASFMIENATAGTFFSVFTLGNDPTRVDLALINSETFAGEADGIADIRSIRVNAAGGGGGSIGGINAADANFAADSGVIGIEAEDISVQRFLFVGDMTPSGTTQPRLRISGDSPLMEVLITGGDLAEATGDFQIDTNGVVYPFDITATTGQRSISDSNLRPDLGDGSRAPVADTFAADADAYFATDGQRVLLR